MRGTTLLTLRSLKSLTLTLRESPVTCYRSGLRLLSAFTCSDSLIEKRFFPGNFHYYNTARERVQLFQDVAQVALSDFGIAETL